MFPRPTLKGSCWRCWLWGRSHVKLLASNSLLTMKAHCEPRCAWRGELLKNPIPVIRQTDQKALPFPLNDLVKCPTNIFSQEGGSCVHL